MLEQFMTNFYTIPSYTHLNDRLLYIDYIDRNYTYKEGSIEPVEAYRYQGNLFGVFKALGIPSGLYVYAMYLNGYNNPTNYDGVQYTFKIPVRVPIPEY